MKDIFARWFKKTAVQLCTVNIMHLSSCNIMYSHIMLVFIFGRLKINHDSHEFILESGTVANNSHLHQC
jgi:hypothetical protein